MVVGCRSSSFFSAACFVLHFILLLDLPTTFSSQLLDGLEEEAYVQPGTWIQLPQSNRSKTRRRRRAPLPMLSLSVHQFGAKGDGCTDDTQAFVNAWKRACSSRSVATIEIPEGYEYLVSPLNFSGPCKSKMTMLISGNITAPSDPDAWEGLDTHKWLYFRGVKDLSVKGGGTINGMGHEWWARSCKRNATMPCRHAPTAITFHRAKRLTIQDLTLINSQQMHIAFTSCFQVKASQLKVIAPSTSPNTDGIHISASNFIIVEESTVRTGDDCVSIVSNTSNVLIRNLVCGPGHGISIGSLGKSNATDQVRNVRVDGAFISDTENGVRIKTWQGGHGYARNIFFHNILMKNVSNPIIIDQYYCDSKHPCRNQTSAVKVDHISFISIKGTSATQEVMKFACSDTSPCKNIYLEDIQLFLDSEEDPAAFCWNASGFTSGLVYPSSCLSSADPLIEENVASDTALQSMKR